MKDVIEVGAAVIRRNGLYLICRRRPEDSSGGLWEFPGGKREPGETMAACAVREIKEELDCEIEAGELLTRLETEYCGRYFHIYFFHATLASGEPRPVECSELAWVTASDMPGYDWLKTNLTVLPMLK